jgi:hypothetical protein
VVSPASHVPFPQVEAKQSSGQLRRVSPAPQTRSPQVEVVAQSAGQLAAVSPLSQFPSPQPLAQSVGQVCRVSLLLQMESPQKQSCGQVTGLSLSGAQSPSPHCAGSIGFSPIGARPHAAPAPTPAANTPAQQASLNRPQDLEARARDMILRIETRRPARRKRRRTGTLNVGPKTDPAAHRAADIDRDCRSEVQWAKRAAG